MAFTHGAFDMVAVELTGSFVRFLQHSCMSEITDSDLGWLQELLSCHRAVSDCTVEPAESVVIPSTACIADEAGTTLPISVESEPVQFASSEEESLSDWAESWIHELCGRPGHEPIDPVANMGDREWRRQLDLQQDSQCSVTRPSTQATTVGLSSVEIVGPLATHMRPATPSAVSGVSLLSLDLAKLENFSAVAKHEADHSRGQAVYAPEVPRQDSITFVGTKDCPVPSADMDLAMLCGGHNAHGPFFDHAVSRLLHLIIAKRPRRYAQQLEATKAPNNQTTRLQPLCWEL
jgi:hypothetical protein